MSRSARLSLSPAERAERKAHRVSGRVRRANIRRAHTRHGVISLALRDAI